MKLLVIGLEGASAAELLEGEELTRVRHLMTAGCYGRLGRGGGDDPWRSVVTGNDSGEGETLAERVDDAGNWAIVMREPDDGSDVSVEGAAEATRAHFERLRGRMETESWEYVEIADAGLARVRRSAPEAVSEFCSFLDEQVGSLLETLAEDTVVLVLTPAGPDGGDGAFVLASSAGSGGGEIEGARARDLCPTLLELGGYDLPGSLEGESLLPRIASAGGGDEVSADEEELIRERLRGLGYL